MTLFARLALPVILLSFFIAAVAYSVFMPIWEGPDEPEHFQYVRYLIEQHALPIQLPTVQPDGNNEGKQAPLYYLLAVPFAAGVDLTEVSRIRFNPHAGWQGARDAQFSVAHVLDEGWPYHGIFLAAHRIRILSALLGTATVALTYACAASVTRDRRTSLLAAVLVACLPGFLFASSTINNDALANMLGAALLLLALKARHSRRWSWPLAFGIVGALGMFTKLDLLIAILLGVLAIVTAPDRRLRVRLYSGLLATVPLVSTVPFWLWRIAQGDKRLLGRTLAWPPHMPASGAVGRLAVWQFVQHTWISFFGDFGWAGPAIPPYVYALYGAGLLTGLGAAVWPRRKKNCSPPRLQDVPLLWLFPVAFLFSLAVAGLLVANAGATYAVSRLVYPSLAAIGTLVAFGWRRLTTASRGILWVAKGALALDAAAIVAIPALLLRPHLPTPWPVSDRLPPSATPIASAYLGHDVALAGATLPSGPIGAGNGVYVSLYWRVQAAMPAGEWLFIHIVNGAGTRVAAFDGSPSSSTLPLSYWRRGDTVWETEVLTIGKLVSPGAYYVHVGWYDPKTGTRLASDTGQSSVSAGTVQIVSGTG